MYRIGAVSAAAVILTVGLMFLSSSEAQLQDQNTNARNTNTTNRNSGNMNRSEMNGNATGDNMNRDSMNANMRGDNMNGNSNMRGDEGMMRGDNMGRMSGMLSQDDRKFMMMAAQGGMAEVAWAQAALNRAVSPAVKTYAQQMIDDHTKAGEELKELANAKGVTLPADMDAKQRAMLDKLNQKSGADFDRMYVKESGVKAHEKMAQMFRKQMDKGQEAELQSFVSRTLPVVEMHLRMARSMKMGADGMMMMPDDMMRGNMNGNNNMRGNSNNSNRSFNSNNTNRVGKVRN